MQDDFKPIEPLPPISELRLNLSQPKTRISPPVASESFAKSRSAPVSPAQRCELPATYLTLEPRPISAYDDNPVFNEIGAARLIGVTADCLKKWRQRKEGPDYIQYGRNGAVRYELKALMKFRDKHRVRHTRQK